MENNNLEYVVQNKNKSEIKKKGNRQIKYQEETKYDVLNLSPESLENIADFLNSDTGVHIDEIYFCADGKYYLNKYKFEGNGLYYSRLEKVGIRISDEETGVKILANKNNEIIKTVPAEDIIDIVYQWRQDKREQELLAASVATHVKETKKVNKK